MQELLLSNKRHEHETAGKYPWPFVSSVVKWVRIIFMAVNDLPQTSKQILMGLEKTWHIGAQLYVSRPGHAPLNRVWGEDGRGRLMTPQTLNLWMSAGKPLTATAILQLQEKGLLDIESPVSQYIPEFAVHDKQSFTLRQLLTHTAPLRQGDLVPPQPWPELIRALCRIRPEPRWVPGEKAAYHIGGTWYLLGEVVHRVSGLSISDYLRRHVFDPLHMNRSFLGLNDAEWAEVEEGVAVMQQTEKMPAAPHPIFGRPEVIRQPRPGSNCLGPAGELGKFYEALLEEGRGILKPETVALMTRRHRQGMKDHTFGHVLDMGLGVIVNSNRYGPETVPYGYGRYATDYAFGHCGNKCSAGFADPPHGLVVVLVFNGMPSEPVHQSRMREVLSALYVDLGLA